MEQMLKLCDLRLGQAAVTVQVGPAAAARLRDIGLTSGTTVTCVGVSPLGDPAAYDIRGAVVALRREDSAAVMVQV